LSDHVTMYSVISHHLNTVAVTMVRITFRNICFYTFIIKKTRTPWTRNGTNFGAHVSHKSLNEIKWKHTTVDQKLLLLPKKNIYVRSLVTHTVRSQIPLLHMPYAKRQDQGLSLTARITDSYPVIIKYFFTSTTCAHSIFLYHTQLNLQQGSQPVSFSFTNLPRSVVSIRSL